MIPQQDTHGGISHGAILVEGNTFLPESMRLESDASGAGWARVADCPDRNRLEERLAGAGWTFHYMAGALRTISFGFEAQSMTQRAVKSMIASVKRQKCNCVEIDEIATHSFLGMPYVSVSAHARQIQKNMVFSGQ